MAITQNTYTGNGSTTLYSFSFPYISPSHIKVEVNGAATTAYTLVNSSTIQFNTAPAYGASIRIYRITDDSQPQAVFSAGSAIKAQDLNVDFTQAIYAVQESRNEIANAVAGQIAAGSIGTSKLADGAVTTSKVADGAITGSKIADATIQSASLAFTQSGTGAVTRSVSNKLKERASLEDFGAVGDGSTSDQAAYAAAVGSGFSDIHLKSDGKYLITNGTNLPGVTFSGTGSLVASTAYGLNKLNTYADSHKYVFGLEYMAAFHNLLITQITTPTRAPIIVFSGDSTTVGAEVSDQYKIHNVIKNFAFNKGLNTPYGTSFINRGQSGNYTKQWADTHVTGDLAASPDLLVLRWGINDPGYLQNGTQPSADAGQSYSGRRTAADMLADLRRGLATVRASRGVGSLSIILMSPNSTYDIPNGRDSLYYEQLVPGLKQVAREYKCVFIDTYGLYRDSQSAAGIWMDDPMGAYPAGAGRAIHPLSAMNTWIGSVLGEVIFPEGLRTQCGFNRTFVVGGAQDLPLETYTPDLYPVGIYRIRTLGGNWPFDGWAETIRFCDNVAVQYCYPYKTSDAGKQQIAWRIGRAADLGSGNTLGWEAWNYLGEKRAALTAATGFSVTTARVQATGHSTVIVEGRLVKTTPGVISISTALATVPAGYRPGSYQFGTITIVGSGGSSGVYETFPIGIGTDGSITISKTTTGITVGELYFNALWTTNA